MIFFVTGATGFIGRHLVRRLLADGHRVRCLARHPEAATRLFGDQVEVVTGCVNDLAILQDAMCGCDGLFHLANLYSMWERQPARFQEVNVEGTRVVLECALTCQLKQVVYVSTVAVYGEPSTRPFIEETPPGPRLFSEYARTKAQAEHIAWDLHRQRGLPLVVLYPGIVLGAADEKASGRYIQDIIRRRVPSTIFHRSLATYVYVEDLVETMLQAMLRPQAAGQKYLVGGYTLSGREYAQLVSEVSGVPLPFLRLPDWMVITAAYLLTALSVITQRSPVWGLSVDAAWTLKKGFCIDGSKARRELGIAYTPIRVALAEAIDSYRAQWNKRGLRVSKTP